MDKDLAFFYKSLGSLWCPTVKDNVVFNNHGWIHLRYNSNRKKRQVSDIKLRLKLFPQVPDVIKHAKVIIKQNEGRITSKSGITRRATFYEIASETDNGEQHITVILRRIEEGKLHFFSVRRTSEKTKKALRGLS